MKGKTHERTRLSKQERAVVNSHSLNDASNAVKMSFLKIVSVPPNVK